MQIVGDGRSVATNDPLLKKFFREICRAETEGDGRRQDDASPRNAESNYHDVLSDAQLFECHRSGEELQPPP